MVWICEFQAEGERIEWRCVYGTRKEALIQGKFLETQGYKRKQVIPTIGNDNERIKQYEDHPEKHSLLDNEYQILKQEYYYYGA